MVLSLLPSILGQIRNSYGHADEIKDDLLHDLKTTKNDLSKIINAGHNELLTLRKEVGEGRKLLDTITDSNHTNDLIELSMIAALGFVIGLRIAYYFLFERKKLASDEVRRSNERKSLRRFKRRFSHAMHGVFKTKEPRQSTSGERGNRQRDDVEDESSEEDDTVE